jgi:hypothetical protein
LAFAGIEGGEFGAQHGSLVDVVVADTCWIAVTRTQAAACAHETFIDTLEWILLQHMMVTSSCFKVVHHWHAAPDISLPADSLGVSLQL